MAPASHRALLRISWRDTVRNRARSLLVIALVAVPVAAVTAGLCVFRTTDPTPDARATGEMGQADLLVTLGSPVDRDDLQARLPADAEVAPFFRGRAEVTAGASGDTVTALLMGLDPTGLAEGIVETTTGTAPRTDTDASLSASVADQLGLAIGDDIHLADRRFEVVGIHREPEALSRDSVLVPPAAVIEDGAASWLVDLGDTAVAAALDGLQAPDGTPSISVVTRADAGARGRGQEMTLTVLGLLALVEAALVVAAAMAVSTRRRQRELGLVAAVGGDDRHLRRAVLWAGIVLGAVGSAIGVALGLGATIAMYPWLQSWADRALHGLRLPVGHVAVVAAGGVAAVTAAAWVPAHGASRLPVLQALSGRRPPVGSAGRSLSVGIGLSAVGVATVVMSLPVGLRTQAAGDVVPLMILLGSVLTVLGFGAMSPWLLDRLGRASPHLPLGPRLALRDTARYRTRNGPMVTAIMAGLAMSVAVAAGLESLQAADPERTTALHWIVLGFALLLGLAVLTIALALSAAETRNDQRLLLAVGANPGLRRSLAAGRAAVLAGLGGALAVPAGLLPAWGVIQTAATFDLVVPWGAIGVVALGLPAVAVVGAYLLTRPSPPWTAYRPPPP